MDIVFNRMKGSGKMGDKRMTLKEFAALGAKYEEKLNSLIKDKLNDNGFIDLANEGIQQHVKTLKSLRQFNQLVAQQLNLPTKDDIANIARLTMQLEEKLDQIEDQLFKLLEEIQSGQPQELILPKHTTVNKTPKGKTEQSLAESGETEELNFEKSAGTPLGETPKADLVSLLKPVNPNKFFNTFILPKRRKRRG